MIRLLYEKKTMRRMSFLLANVAAAALFVWFIVLPISEFFGAREGDIVDQRNVLSRLAGIAAQEPYVRSMEAATSSQLMGGEVLSGPNDSVINADLQTKLKATSEGAGARLRAMQSLPTRTHDAVKYSGARVEIFGSLQSIYRAISALENAKPYLFILGASIKTTPSVGRTSVPEEPTIQAQLDVFGAVQGEGRGP